MNRIVETNGHVKAKVKPVKAVKVKSDGLYFFAMLGVVVMAGLSALLNDYANALQSPILWAGWGMGLVIPAIILILGKVAGLLYNRGNHRGAYITGGVGIGLLAMSVWHCATTIAVVTGSPLLLAMPMAVAIDCGFVACEVAALRA